MESKKIKVFTLVVSVASVFVLFGIAVYKIQPKSSLPVEPSLTQAPFTLSTIPPSPTFPPLSATALENLFGNSSCSLPCWQGITPGITISNEALQRLNDSPLILKKYSIQSDGSITGLGTADWRWEIDDKRPEEDGNMKWRDGIVWWMELTTSPSISIGEIINRLGTPEKVDVSQCGIPENLAWCGILYYAKSGFQIHMRWEGFEVQITPSDPIGFIRLFEPSTIEDWLSSNGLDIQNINLRDWKGYGNLYDLYVR